MNLASMEHEDGDIMDKEASNDDVEWKVGNVYDDLDQLERAITLSNAEQHLRQVEDRERLDTFATNRRPVVRDVRNYILFPSILALMLSFLLRRQGGGISILARFLVNVSSLHFYLFTVLTPLLLYWNKQRLRLPDPPLPPELRLLDPEYFRFIVTDWEDPKTSCRDTVLCLLEQWSSAILGAALLAWARPRNVPSLAVVARFLTRLGALASLHQYPQLLYKLKRHHQPRPMDQHTMRLQQVVSSTLSVAPFGAACDLGLFLTRLPGSSNAALTLLGASTLTKQLLKQRQSKSTIKQPLAARLATGLVLSLTQGTSLVWMAKSLPTVLLPRALASIRNHPTAVALGSLWFALYTFGPLCHLLAVRKLFRFAYTHDISLANDFETVASILSDPVEMKKRLKHRYRLEWRKPERIFQTFSNWKSGFSYWLLFEGGVEDQLRKDFQANNRGEAHRQGLTVLQRVEQDQKDNPDSPRPSSTKWKARAMKKLAAKHERDYKKGTFDDPLGVAVQQTFGIGLGYNFDHMTELKSGETPSPRRLQARAAKSAIRRVQDIYNAEAAREQLDSIKDPAERRKQSADLRQKAEEEITFLARRLSDLIPTDSTLDPGRPTQVKQFVRRDFKRSSNHEMIVGSDSASVDSLLDRRTTDDDDSTEIDNDFVEEWLERQAQLGDDGDEEDSMVLV